MNIMSKTMTSRVAQALKESDLIPAELARRVGISESAIHQWLSGRVSRIKSEHIPSISLALNVRSEWIITGKGPMRSVSNSDPSIKPTERYKDPHVLYSTTPRLTGKVYLIAWDSLKNINKSGIANIPKIRPINEFVPASPNAFALEILDDSMVSSDPYPLRSFPIGSYIQVDPDKPLKFGNGVIALVDGNPTFRQYANDAGKAFLRPFNARYSNIPVDDSVEIIGSVCALLVDIPEGI